MNYFWVNQGKTFNAAYEYEWLWAPLVDANGKSKHFWDTMKLLQPGDVIINYSQKEVLGYCVAQTKAYNYRLPKEFNRDLLWEEEGLLCDVKYYLFEKPLSRELVYQKIKDKLSDKYSPFNVKGEVNQGYLYSISKEEFDSILELANTTYESLNIEVGVDDNPIETETLALGKRRIGQGKYRRDVIKLWQGKCAITGSSIQQVLIASHIVPWKDANSKEKIDENNSILLSALFDKLFDKYLISFTDLGDILISNKISLEERNNLGLSENLSISFKSNEMKIYMNQHRKMFQSLT